MKLADGRKRPEARAARALLREVAASVDAPGPLADVLDQLFDPLHALGCRPRVIARLLAQAGVERHARVLDLACGKGAAAVQVCKQIGCTVLGVDAFPPFVHAAGRLADRRGVGRRCSFIVGDLRAVTSSRYGPFDAAMMVGLWPVNRAAPLLARLVGPGGVYLVDDAVLDPRGGSFRERRAFADVPTLADVIARLNARGDQVLAVHAPTPSATARLNATLLRRLAVQADLLACQRPDLRAELRRFLSRQREAGQTLCGALRPVVLVCRASQNRT